MNFENSKMYPGLPEYFDNEGRGLYAYLTGAASWYMLTMITEVFGVKGDLGDLVIAPSLLPEQFDEKGSAGLKLEFARKKFEIIMHNPEKKDLRIEQIRRAVCDEKVVLEPEPEYGVRLRKSVIETLDPKKCHRIDVFFSRVTCKKMTDRVREERYRFCVAAFFRKHALPHGFIIFIPVFFGRQSGIVFKKSE